jgi:hypothetical protein
MKRSLDQDDPTEPTEFNTVQPDIIEQKLLGAGRSGEVFLLKTTEQQIARKIFFADPLANLVHYIFSGAPNPYIWNEDAIWCAYYRRKILSDLIQVWFGSYLQVADALSVDWHCQKRAYQLDAQFVQGRAVALRQPFRQGKDEEFPELVHHIMRPLQRKLIESGCDGLVWQAGKGNPVALNNFLLTESSAEADINGNKNSNDDRAVPHFVWIDLESGVPALFPLNILTLFSFYIPKSLHHKQALLDDIDTAKLMQFIQRDRADITVELGEKKYIQLIEKIKQLEHHQRRWKSLRRVDRSIQYQYKKGRITATQAQWYTRHPIAWYGREIGRGLRQGLRGLFVTLPLKIADKIQTLQLKKFLATLGKLIISQSYRLEFTRDHVGDRIKQWQSRQQLSTDETEYLLSRLYSEHSSDYLVDFSMHVALKLLIYGFEVTFLPILYALGWINEVGAGILFLLDGPIARSTYTGIRMTQYTAQGKSMPWLALLVGLIPVIGTIAFPCQLIYSAGRQRGKVAQFIVYDSFTRLGQKIPIYGGEDTSTEHFFNRLGHRIIQALSSRHRAT